MRYYILNDIAVIVGFAIVWIIAYRISARRKREAEFDRALSNDRRMNPVRRYYRWGNRDKS